MRIISRISISPGVDEYPYRAPAHIVKQATALCKRLAKYCICEDTMLMLLPIDCDEYRAIMAFVSQNQRYFQNHTELFEREYTKRELEQSEFFVLRIGNIVHMQDNPDAEEYCCQDRCFVTHLNDCNLIRAQSMKNKELGFTTDYRFVVSPKLMKRLEENNISNISFIPGYGKGKGTILGYFIKSKEQMPPVAVINNWKPYLRCQHTGKLVYDSNYMNQFAVTQEIADKLSDFNSTSEMFTELGAREYLISKKMHELLKSMKIRSLSCEPVKIL